MKQEDAPILVGVGQVTQREAEPAIAMEPLDLMVEAAERALADAGLPRTAASRLDSVSVVNILSWAYANPPGALAHRLGAAPTRLTYGAVGGNTPQGFVNQVAGRIAAGEVGFALIAGAEAYATLNRARRQGVTLSWQGGEAPGMPEAEGFGSRKLGMDDHEMSHGLLMPTAIYPLFENALRAHHGWSLERHRQEIGRLCEGLTEVAAHNPHAWFPQRRTADEIMTVSPDNRMVGFPYPKRGIAILEVDQSAALLLTSVGMARRLDIDPSRWVYLSAGADTQDHWYVSERVNFYSSPAIRVAGEQALGQAGLGIADVDFLDLYSCFPCAVQIGRDALGIAADDPRPLTVTGGLPYAGGPGNNYSTHAIARMVELLRAHPGSTGLVTALGWYLTKHSIGVYSSDPPERPFRAVEPERAQARIDAEVGPALAREAEGAAVVETGTVLHERDGTPGRGIIVGRLPDGRRFLANTPEDRGVLERMEAEEFIGRPGQVSCENGLNRFEF